MLGRSLSLHVPIATYTATLSAAGGGASVGNGSLLTKWERWGDSIYVFGRLTWGSTTTAGSGATQISLPNSYLADGGKLVTGGVLMGSAFALDASNHANDCECFCIATGGSNVLTFQPTRVGTAAALSATNPFTWTTSDAFNFAALVPIVGL